ncbi:MAG: hypothetical protein J6B10_04705 [Lachnospiraceae bacterium]|nr:hypothetical protein [Lachnospiraceae bacterium]
MTFKKIGKKLLAGALILCSAVFIAPTANVKASSTPDYSLIFDYNYYYDKYPDLQKAYGKNPFSLFNHFITKGMKEGRQGNKDFNVYNYAANNLDLIMRYGTSDLSLYYIEYITEGYEDGRNCSHPYDPSNEDDKDGDKLSDETLAGYVDSMTTSINQVRTSSDMDRFAVSSALKNAANTRAKELVTLYSHTRPNGKNYTDVLNQYGISCNNSYEIISSDQSTIGVLLGYWLADSGMNSVLTSKTYKYIGIGCASDDKGNVYWDVILTY